MADDQHWQADVFLEPAFELVDVFNVEMIGGFVEYNDVRFAEFCCSDQEEALPAAGEFAELPVREIERNAQVVDEDIDFPAVAMTVGGQGALQHLADRDVFQRRGNFLRHITDAQAARAHDLAGAELVFAGETFQKRRLARAILSDKRRARIVQKERYVLENRCDAILKTAPVDAENSLPRCHEDEFCLIPAQFRIRFRHAKSPP